MEVLGYKILMNRISYLLRTLPRLKRNLELSIKVFNSDQSAFNGQNNYLKMSKFQKFNHIFSMDLKPYKLLLK